VLALRPTWIIVLAGTNDCRRHGPGAVAPLIDDAATDRNLRRMREWAQEEGVMRRLWITPPPVLEERVNAHPLLGAQHLAYRNEDLERKAAIVRSQGDRCVDLWPLFPASRRADL